jgi:ATP synthase protein I
MATCELRAKGEVKMMKKNQPPSAWGSLALMGQLGLTIVLPMALLAIGGYFLDNVTRTRPLFLLLGLLLGLISGIYGAYRLLAPLFKRG